MAALKLAPTFLDDGRLHAALSKLKTLHDGLSTPAAALVLRQPAATRPAPAIDAVEQSIATRPASVIDAVERDEELMRLKSANRALTEELERVREMAERAHVSFATAQRQQAASLAHCLSTDDRIASLAAALEEERGRAQHAESVGRELEIELRGLQRRARMEDSLSDHTEALARRVERESTQAEACTRLASEERRLRMQSEGERERLAHRVLELERTLARVLAANGTATALPPDLAAVRPVPHQPLAEPHSYRDVSAAGAEAHAAPRHHWQQTAPQHASDAAMLSPSPGPPPLAYAGDYYDEYEQSPYASSATRRL